MKKLLSLILLFVLSAEVRADEGMWLPLLVKRLNVEDLNKAGCKLTPEEIYSINQSSLKDKIIQIEGCTAELVSANGLLFTNHHCAYSGIQANSTLEHNYLETGFWAASYGEELPLPGQTASILQRMEDVTAEVLKDLPDTLRWSERKRIVDERCEQIGKRASESGTYRAFVRDFFAGNGYYLFVFKMYKDVRLTGCPPSSVGKFGGETDNWMWPRHTGDFALLRIYASKDGEPAAYSQENKPLKTRNFLSISLKGYKEGDMAMVMGYPGRTNRYATSDQLKMIQEKELKPRVAIQGAILDAWKNEMDKDPQVGIQYAAKYARMSNGWKNSKGMTQGLDRMGLIRKKAREEETFTQWVFSDAARKDAYGYVLTEIQKAVNEFSEIDYQLQYLQMAGRSSELVGLGTRILPLVEAMEAAQPNAARIDSIRKKVLSTLEDFYKNFNVNADRAGFKAGLDQYLQISAEKQPIYVRDILNFSGKTNAEKLESFLEKVYGKTQLCNLSSAKAWLEQANLKALKKEPFVVFGGQVQQFNTEKLLPYQKKYQEVVESNRNKLLKALMEWKGERAIYPDANSTQRLSYGKVKGYAPKDAVQYHWQTFGEGIIEKLITGDPDYKPWRPLVEALQKREFGRYGEGGRLPISFLTTNDITGGNSGSPVLNAEGKLIGLAYDGNWESITGDVVFDSEYKRTICVDIRYVLFIMEKLADAQNILTELRLEP